MSESSRSHSLQVPFDLGDWTVFPQVNELRKGAVARRIEPKAMLVLECLVARAGKVVSRDELLEYAWHDVFVTEGTLSRCISQLRRALDDDPREPQYIETIPKAGYRVIATVRRSIGESSLEQPKVERPRPVISPVSIPLPEPRHSRAIAFTTIGLALVTGAWLAASLGNEMSKEHARTIPLTSMEGMEHSAAISPDGTRVLFVAQESSANRSGLFIKTLSADSPVRIGSASVDAAHPAWTPDGLRLAYFACDDERMCDLVQASALGTDERPIVTGLERPWGLTWSPVGQTVVYSARDPESKTWRLYSRRIGSATTDVLTTPPLSFRGDVNPVFSPDGKTIVFKRSQSEGVAELLLISADGGEANAITHDAASVAGQSWTPDGKRIVFSSSRNGLFQLWSVPVDGGTPTRLSEVAAHDPGFPVISKDGRTLVFEEWNIDVNVWEHRLGAMDTTATRRIASSWWNRQPAISPDGKTVAFVSARSGAPELWRSRVDGSDAFRLTNSSGSTVGTPSWSPDGSSIAYEGFTDGQADIYVVDVAGGSPRRMTSGTADERTPSWSRDGTRIYYSSNESGSWEIYSVALQADDVRRHTQRGGRRAIEATDGRNILVSRFEEPGLWRIPLDGGPAESLNISLAAIDWGNWDLTTGAIYWIQRDSSGAPSLYSVANDLGAMPARLVRLADIVPDEPGISVSANGERLLYSRVEKVTSDLAYVRPFSAGRLD